MDPEGEKVFVFKSGDVSAHRSSTSKHASQGEDTLRGMTVDIESPQSKVNYGMQYTIIPLHFHSCISCCDSLLMLIFQLRRLVVVLIVGLLLCRRCSSRLVNKYMV